ncbi:MAG: hypothetical protein KA248_11415 [Kiritimatiellae bacterium]|nr:hypothetical protein [Kiritimatiellia bacterium]
MKALYPRMALGLMLGFLALAGSAGAQEPDEELPPPAMEEPPPGELAPPPPPAEGRPVDRWMERLERRNPEEYRRYQDMRHRDPEGFRRELAGRLGRERLQKALQAHPRLQAFLESLPEEERADILLALGRALRPEGPPPPHDEGPVQAGQGEIAKLAREFRTASDPAQREQIRADLKARLGELFDAREQRRREHIQRIQAEMTRLQGMLESRRASREEIIERRLQELTADESLKW